MALSNFGFLESGNDNSGKGDVGSRRRDFVFHSRAIGELDIRSVGWCSLQTAFVEALRL